MSRPLPVVGFAPSGCPTCAFFKRPCGGLEHQQSLFGCFEACGSCQHDRETCDYTCPMRPHDFARDWAEVGGLDATCRLMLPRCKQPLPYYVPMIRHGYSRAELFPVDVVALNTFDVLDADCKTKDEGAEQLRDRFLVPSFAKTVLVSVNKDRYVEAFWANLNASVVQGIRRLGVTCMTTPNFSLFEDAPRTHQLRNLWRIVRSAENLADGGVTPILHVNALMPDDWAFWHDVLSFSPDVVHVCKEFQTGLRDPRKAQLAVDGLRRLQDRLGRTLHPVVIGGRRMTARFAQYFRNFTVVDSVPFIATQKRKRIIHQPSYYRQLDEPMALGEPLDVLLQDNVREYGSFVAASAGRKVTAPKEWDDYDDIDALHESWQPTAA